MPHLMYGVVSQYISVHLMDGDDIRYHHHRCRRRRHPPPHHHATVIVHHRLKTHAGWPQSRRTKFPEFSRLFHSHKLTFPQVIATKSKCNNDLHQGSFHIKSSNITAIYDIYWAGLLLPEILMILFTQSTVVLRKYLNNELKVLCFFYNYSLELHRIP